MTKSTNKSSTFLFSIYFKSHNNIMVGYINFQNWKTWFQCSPHVIIQIINVVINFAEININKIEHTMRKFKNVKKGYSICNFYPILLINKMRHNTLTRVLNCAAISRNGEMESIDNSKVVEINYD